MRRKLILVFSISLAIALSLGVFTRAEEVASESTNETCAVPPNLVIEEVQTPESQAIRLGQDLTLILGLEDNSSPPTTKPENNSPDVSGEDNNILGENNINSEASPPKTLKEILANNKFILFLDGYALDGTYGRLINSNTLSFELEVQEASNKNWSEVLSNAMQSSQDGISVGIGCTDKSLLDSGKKILIKPRNWGMLLFLLSLYLITLGSFLKFARESLKDWEAKLPSELAIKAKPAIKAIYKDKYTAPYSLGRVQMAIWFFVILLSFAYIVSITNNPAGIITEQSFALMGVSSATGVGAVLIDNYKNNIKGKEAEASIKTSELQNPTQTKEITELEIKNLCPKSKGFFKDLISDIKGPSLHRIQMLSWTILLAIFFLFRVFTKLEFTVFDDTLLLLQGMSSLTYLGFKFPEPPKGDATSEGEG